eukprot:CAMPEP_0119552502 /NCGR_PEP_ID=MMETSP1352-20130426/5472_1 /TAXON_ID=265584 /ORGANISM="Stauroneis constricta, Strain CCMP1120" /LENGTH=305 /DNA_ID=CAMNT_0007598743 /DNA_START=105 /DNA_END=1022 /DNA_ORIENTATION=+
MKLSIAATSLAIAASLHGVSGFLCQPATQRAIAGGQQQQRLFGYLDDLTNGPADADDAESDDSREATNMPTEQLDRAGPGTWEGFVDFDEFDGGDGQMGVAGDGNSKLEAFDMTEIAKSKSMSAKNAWGRSTGYAETLIAKGVDTQRAQQLENWNNQQEVLANRKQQQYMADEFDKVSNDDENWRNLASFGVERNQDFDLDSEFGPVVPGNVDGVIELKQRIGGPMAYHEFSMVNEYMGFADFRAAFTPETGAEWTVEPKEGALSKSPVNFTVRFKPQTPGIVEGYLVIDTEDFKKTYKLVGGTM